MNFQSPSSTLGKDKSCDNDNNTMWNLLDMATKKIENDLVEKICELDEKIETSKNEMTKKFIRSVSLMVRLMLQLETSVTSKSDEVYDWPEHIFIEIESCSIHVKEIVSSFSDTEERNMMKEMNLSLESIEKDIEHRGQKYWMDNMTIAMQDVSASASIDERSIAQENDLVLSYIHDQVIESLPLSFKIVISITIVSSA
jgi:hypothetical protein